MKNTKNTIKISISVGCWRSFGEQVIIFSFKFN